mgnify:CR=1 FL=1
MMITRIELENITTHKKTKIDFQQGLNLLYGQNGTGKSTILKMIGYILFDFLPGTQQNYVRKRHGKKIKYGNVKVWIVNSDGDLFVIQRSLAKANIEVEVRNERTGFIVRGVNSVTDLKEWIRDQLSLGDDLNLSDLFETSIGVPQGTFTEPFLRTPQKRKNFFNPILQVEVYRKVWKKLYEIIKLFDEDLQKARVKESGLTAELKPMDEYREKLDKNKIKLENSQNELENVDTQFNRLKNNYQELESLSKTLENERNHIKELKAEQKPIKENLKGLKQRFESAEKAKKICESAKADFERYVIN